LPQPPQSRTLESMNPRRLTDSRRFSLLCGLLLSLAVPRRTLAEPTPAAIAAFNAYVSALEARLAQQHRSPQTFVIPNGQTTVIERLTPATGSDLPGAQLHHWRGTAFVLGANAAAFEHLLRDFKSYPQLFAPQVLNAEVLSSQPDHLVASMRVRQKHVLTVVLDTTYDVTFARLDPHDGSSISRSTHIYEIDDAGRATEDHGFLWRLNTYWTFEERDGGLYIQIESVSLSRSIPTGLAWAIRPYVDSVPRESLEFTLQSACKALKEKAQ